MYMTIQATWTDEAVLAELGRRVQAHRLARNVTQAQLAEEAGLSVPTLQRLEAGASVQLASLLRVLRVLNRLDRLEAVLPADPVRPLAMLKPQRVRRQRASGRAAPPSPTPWTWKE